MAWAGEEVHRAAAVVLGSLILISHYHSDGRAECDAELCAGLNLNAVLLVTRRGQSTLARTSPRHLRLDIILSELHAWWAAINNTANGPAMRLAIAVPLIRHRKELVCLILR